MHGTKSFYIIDCSYHFRASFFVLPAIYSPDGKLVNAVYGFVSVLLKLLRDRHPDALAVADDAPWPYFRHELFRGYKAEKRRVPEECDQQRPILRRVLDAMSIPYLRAQGFEADDVIASLAPAATRYGYRVYICSKDKDLQQLLTDDVTILDTSSGREVTPATLEQDKGIRPDQIPDMLALAGDKVDSIPGIPGIGQRTAGKLLNTYGALENILRQWQEVGGKLGANIREHRQQALLAKKLTTLRRDVPIDMALDEFKSPLRDKDAVESLFRELGFDRLLKRLEGVL